MKNKNKYLFITKTVILSLFVLFFGVIYVVFINTNDYNPADLLETYIVETSKSYITVNEYAGFNTYETKDSIINKLSTDSNVVTIEMYVFGDDENDNNDTIISSNSDLQNADNDKKQLNESESSINVDTNLININKATAEDLDTLPKIGPSIANAILEYREKYGDFKTIDQIKNVTGIGEKIFNTIKDLITV